MILAVVYAACHSGVATAPENLQQCETIDARSLT
jgi:hypothetical protein